jgi:hypothetical protein
MNGPSDSRVEHRDMGFLGRIRDYGLDPEASRFIEYIVSGDSGKLQIHPYPEYQTKIRSFRKLRFLGRPQRPEGLVSIA